MNLPHVSFGPNPARDWYAVLLIAIALLIVEIAVGVFFFVGIRSGQIVGSAEGAGESMSTVTRGEVSATLDLYRVRQTNYEARNFPRPALKDPSR